MGAVAGSIGIADPGDPSLDQGLDLAASLEGYLTARVSVRGQLGGSWWDITGRGFTGTVRPVRIDGNVVYNWELGVWHPYATTGPGVYHYRSTTGGRDGGDTEVGWNFGGGVEYFFHRRTTLIGEVLYHKVGSFNTPATTFNDGSYWSLNLGVKGYFGK